jgi:hypothetical protein
MSSLVRNPQAACLFHSQLVTARPHAPASRTAETRLALIAHILLLVTLPIREEFHEPWEVSDLRHDTAQPPYGNPAPFPLLG